jgi:hypothetical protein
MVQTSKAAIILRHTHSSQIDYSWTTLAASHSVALSYSMPMCQLPQRSNCTLHLFSIQFSKIFVPESVKYVEGKEGEESKEKERTRRKHGNIGKTGKEWEPPRGWRAEVIRSEDYCYKCSRIFNRFGAMAVWRCRQEQIKENINQMNLLLHFMIGLYLINVRNTRHGFKCKSLLFSNKSLIETFTFHNLLTNWAPNLFTPDAVGTLTSRPSDHGNSWTRTLWSALLD